MSMFRQGAFRLVGDARYDKWIFLCAFAGGTVLIGAFRLLDVPPFATLAIPTVILGTYTLYVMGTARLSVSLDRAGDNIYYLGLLFTLVTLSISLYQVFQLENGAKAVFDLMSAFGLALWSTILGMFLRVFVQEFRRDPADVENEVRADLAEAARSLRAELFAMTADINSYRRASTQSIEELQGELSQSLRGIVQDASNGISETSKQLGRTTSRLEKLGTRQGDVFESLLNTVEATVNELVDRLQGIEIDTKAVSSKFDGVTDALTHTAQRINERATAEQDAINQLRQFVSALEDLTRPALRQDMAAVVNGVADMAEHARLANESLDALKEAMDASRTKLTTVQAEGVQALEELLGQMRRQAEISERSTREVQDGLLESVRALRSEVKR